MLKSLKCLFDDHKTLDQVKDKLKHNVASTNKLEDQLTEALTEKELTQLEIFQPSDGFGQLTELERERNRGAPIHDGRAGSNSRLSVGAKHTNTCRWRAPIISKD